MSHTEQMAQDEKPKVYGPVEYKGYVVFADGSAIEIRHSNNEAEAKLFVSGMRGAAGWEIKLPQCWHLNGSEIWWAKTYYAEPAKESLYVAPIDCRRLSVEEWRRQLERDATVFKLLEGKDK
jgi:hypothetical protein